jgi:hypothetical protein
VAECDGFCLAGNVFKFLRIGIYDAIRIARLSEDVLGQVCRWGPLVYVRIFCTARDAFPAPMVFWR